MVKPYKIGSTATTCEHSILNQKTGKTKFNTDTNLSVLRSNNKTNKNEMANEVATTSANSTGIHITITNLSSFNFLRLI